MNEYYMNGLNGEKYSLDIDAITKWCLSSSLSPSKETEINEGYDYGDNGDFQMTTKVVRELKTSNSQDDTIRYDFIKNLLSPFMGDISNFDEVLKRQYGDYMTPVRGASCHGDVLIDTSVSYKDSPILK